MVFDRGKFEQRRAKVCRHRGIPLLSGGPYHPRLAAEAAVGPQQNAYTRPARPEADDAGHLLDRTRRSVVACSSAFGTLSSRPMGAYSGNGRLVQSPMAKTAGSSVRAARSHGNAILAGQPSLTRQLVAAVVRSLPCLVRGIGAATGRFGKRRDISPFAAPRQPSNLRVGDIRRKIIFFNGRYCLSTEKYPLIPTVARPVAGHQRRKQMKNTASIPSPTRQRALDMCAGKRPTRFAGAVIYQRHADPLS
jgi:hypothetical protein